LWCPFFRERTPAVVVLRLICSNSDQFKRVSHNSRILRITKGTYAQVVHRGGEQPGETLSMQSKKKRQTVSSEERALARIAQHVRESAEEARTKARHAKVAWKQARDALLEAKRAAKRARKVAQEAEAAFRRAMTKKNRKEKKRASSRG
jgi:hypothetical protein